MVPNSSAASTEGKSPESKEAPERSGAPFSKMSVDSKVSPEVAEPGMLPLGAEANGFRWVSASRSSAEGAAQRVQGLNVFVESEKMWKSGARHGHVLAHALHGLTLHAFTKRAPATRQ